MAYGRALIAVAGLAFMSSAWAEGTACVPNELLPADDTPVSESSVKMRLVDPSNGSAVDASSVVVVDVDYRVAHFEPEKFGLMMSFVALTSATSPHGPEGLYKLRQALGRVRLCVTLREVYETSRLRWPLRMWVGLNKVARNDSPKFSAVFEDVARSEEVALNSVAPTRETERVQDTAVDPGYRDAVYALAGTVAQSEALGQLCPRFPELEVEFTAAHDAWVSRNASMIEQIRALHRDLYQRDIARADIVDEIMKRHGAIVQSHLAALPEAKLREQCRYFGRAFSNPASDLQSSGAAQLAVIRERMPSRPPAGK